MRQWLHFVLKGFSVCSTSLKSAGLPAIGPTRTSSRHPCWGRKREHSQPPAPPWVTSAPSSGPLQGPVALASPLPAAFSSLVSWSPTRDMARSPRGLSQMQSLRQGLGCKQFLQKCRYACRRAGKGRTLIHALTHKQQRRTRDTVSVCFLYFLKPSMCTFVHNKKNQAKRIFRKACRD